MSSQIDTVTASAERETSHQERLHDDEAAARQDDKSTMNDHELDDIQPTTNQHDNNISHVEDADLAIEAIAKDMEQKNTPNASSQPKEVMDKPVPEADSTPSEPYSVFTNAEVNLIVVIVSLTCSFSAISSNIYFPALPEISRSLDVSNSLLNLTVTTYMIWQAFGPPFWGALADVYGRRITYIGTITVYFFANLGMANTKHYYQLLILRCMQSAGSAATIALGAGVIGDITERDKRGGYMGIYQSGLLLPVAIGPVIGGVFAGTTGWHGIFWFLVVYCGIIGLTNITLLPETLRALVGNGSIPPPRYARSLMSIWVSQRWKQPSTDVELAAPATSAPATTSGQKKASFSILRPIKIVLSRSCGAAALFLAVYYTSWQMQATVTSTLFARVYGLTELQIGLTYLSLGSGCILASFTNGKLLDAEYRRVKAKWDVERDSSNNGTNQTEVTDNSKTDTPAPPPRPATQSTSFPLERARLGTMPFWAALQCAATLVFGWTVDRHVHLAAPVIASFFLGVAVVMIEGSTMTYLVDVHPGRSASAIAGLNFARCLVGAGGTAAALPLIEAVGTGVGFTIMAALMAVLGALALGVQMRFGSKFRAELEEREAE